MDYFMDEAALVKVEDGEAFIRDRVERTVKALRALRQQSGQPKAITIAFSPSYCSVKYIDMAPQVLQAILDGLDEE